LIPHGVTGIFHWHNPSGRTMSLGLTQPLKETSTRNTNFLGGKGGQCVGLTTLPPSYADCLEIWEPHPPGTLWARIRFALPLPLPPGTSVGVIALPNVASYRVTPLKTSVPRVPLSGSLTWVLLKFLLLLWELLTRSEVQEQHRKVSSKCWHCPDIS